MKKWLKIYKWRLKWWVGGRRLADELDDIARRCAELPARDARTDQEIVGFDGDGVPR